MKIVSPKVYRPWLEAACYALRREVQSESYCMFLQKIVVRATEDNFDNQFLAAIGGLPDGRLAFTFSWPKVEKFDMPASVAVLKHEVLHAIHGQLGTKMLNLVQEYGKDVFNLAADCVVNQYVDTQALERYGYYAVTRQRLGLDPGLTTTQYCELISKRPDVQDFVAAYKIGEKFGPWEKFISECDPEMLDTAVAELVEDVKNAMEKKGDDVGREWNSGEVEEFIQQLHKQPSMRWDVLLRSLESWCRKSERVATVLRPSRRHDEFMGRVRKQSLLVWFGIDSSGSMGEKQLSCLEAELRGIVQRGAEVHVVQVDTEVKRKDKFNTWDKLEKFYGRGGTDFSPFFLELEATPRQLKPRLAVFYTDGYGCCTGYLQAIKKRYPAQFERMMETRSSTTPDGVEVLWLLAERTTSEKEFLGIVPFGRVATLKVGDHDVSASASR